MNTSKESRGRGRGFTALSSVEKRNGGRWEQDWQMALEAGTSTGPEGPQGPPVGPDRAGGDNGWSRGPWKSDATRYLGTLG